MQTHPLKVAFQNLGLSGDLLSIKFALHRLCSEFGVVKCLEVLLARQGSKRQALCFLKMEKTEQEAQIMQFFAVSRYAGDLVVVVDLPLQKSTAVVDAPMSADMLAMA